MVSRSPVPRFFLYGEPPRDTDERFVHVETIADRSRLYDWHIRPHGHRDLHQILVSFTGGGEMQAETQRQPFSAPALLTAPCGVVYGFAFAPETEGYVLTFADALFRNLARQEPAFRTLFAAASCASLGGDPAEKEDLADALPRLKRELAWQALGSTAAIIAETAYYLGFGDPAYFSRFFRKLAGEAAAAFRKRVSK